MSIGRRLGLGFGLVLALMVAITTYGVFEVNSIDRSMTTITDLNAVKQRYAINFRGSVHDRAISLRDVVLHESMPEVDAAVADIARLADFYAESNGPLTRMLADRETADAEETAIFASIREIEADTLPLIEKVIVLRRAGDLAQAHAVLMRDAAPAFSEWLARINKFIDLQERKNQHLTASARATAGQFATLMLVLCVLAIVLGAAIAYRITRKLLATLGGEPDAVVAAVGRIAAGDLGSKVEVRPGDEASLVYSLSVMQQSLQGIVAEIRDIVDAAGNRGDFSLKMRVEGKSGFMRDLSELLNALSNVTETGLKDVGRVASALAAGDLSQRIEKEYPGLFGQTRQSVNQTVDSLAGIVEALRGMVDAAANRGDFSVKMDTAGKQGYALTLGELLNQLFAVIDQGLGDIRRVAQALSDGDLTEKIERAYPGVLGEVTATINSTVGNLESLVAEIKRSAGVINTASREIASGNQDLSSRTNEQASSLEETASSLEELTSTVRQNAESARQANDYSNQAEALAARGGEVVAQVVHTMSAIHQSSSKIADIIGVIDGIAFQTNILALNAAVEAARAGEQGRGFAVVATEVRNLAQRSAIAAKDIKELISDSVAKVQDGNQQVDQAGRTMDEVVAGIQRVARIVNDIARASQEQSQGIEQVGKAMSSLDDVTQQNAALVEEAAASAESLLEQADQLARAIAVFRLANGAAQVLPAPAARVAKSSTSGARAAAAPGAAKRPALPETLDDEWAEF